MLIGADVTSKYFSFPFDWSQTKAKMNSRINGEKKLLKTSANKKECFGIYVLFSV